jgi:myosin tail region-interacting protein MTI1
MSDQQPSPPPPKPKPGSLRDRIAAFEKSATPAAATGQSAPAPRPKPSGFATWKPKVPSPPSSPSSKSVDNAAPSSSLKATGTMSASDAKESITKGGGGSLKDRMAALQGKGAFGAPAPPLAPKPAADKPRWKPPPAVPAVDNDGHHEGAINESPAAAIATALDRNKSPPVSVKSRESLDLPNITEGEETSAAEPTACAEGDADAEEEERQRRAAIAARMARLGGARLGMSPPVLAKKPPMPVRKSTREDVPKQEDREEVLKRGSLSLEERGKNVEGKVSSPPVDEG